jgi:hypothetical protein
MLFYSQIKKRFSQNDWRKGQGYFFENRIQAVQLQGTRVSARLERDDPAAVALTVQRGTFAQPSCTRCAINNDQLCCHLAALCIWIVERGSLLRAGILESPAAGSSAGLEEEEQEPALVPAEPVLFVRPVFENKVFSAIRLEAAIRYIHPESGDKQVDPVAALAREKDPLGTGRIWKNMEMIRLKTNFDIVPILETVDAAPVTHAKDAAMDALVQLLGTPDKSRIEFHPLAQVTLSPEPLKLSKIQVGKKTAQGRLLSYRFENSRFSVSSDGIAQLTELGLVNSRYVWPRSFEGGKTIFRLATPLTMIERYANRSGLTGNEKTVRGKAPAGYSVLEDDQDRPLHPISIYRLSLELGVDDFEVDEEWAEFHEWKKNFEKKKQPPLPVVEYGFSLREYQQNGLSWMWSLYHRRLAALLADEMGLGKTHQVLAFLTSVYTGSASKKSKRDKKLPSLVVAPTSVVAAWSQKLKKYPTGLRWYIFHGKDRKADFDDAQIVLTTYGILQKEASLRNREWEVVILDEAQAIKNATTISSRASRILKSKFRIAMTGTPIENRSTDLWSVMEFLLPGFLGSLPRFKRLYGAGYEAPTAQQTAGLKRLVTPFLLRRTKNQVLKELPEKTEEVIYCSLTPVQKKVYSDYLDSKEATKIRDDLKDENGKVDYAGILSLLTRLKQVCDHPRLPQLTTGKIKRVDSLIPEETGKWEHFEELLTEAIGSDLKVVVFTQYLGMMDLIGAFLEKRGIHYVELRGDTADRNKPLNEFAANPECKVFLCSLLAGGLGIDLTSASVCIHFDRWWNPAKENQATDRLHRIGQTRGVQVFKLQCPGTVEDRIAAIIQSKLALSDMLIEESAVGMKSFSRRELLELLTLHEES